jgi:hypothetical protein
MDTIGILLGGIKMRQLTFDGFLSKYVRELSFCKSNSLAKLSTEAEELNPRLCEPLLLYAFLTHDKNTIRRLFRQNQILTSEFNQHFFQFDNSSDFMSALELNCSTFPQSYYKVYKSYLSLRDRYQNDSHTKSLMKKKIVTLQKQKQLTDYRIYADLHINSGNFNAFMKRDCLDRLSLEATRKVLRYLEDYTPNNTLHKKQRFN